MALFSYTARSQDGALDKGHVDAFDEAAVVDILLRRQAIPISISPSVKTIDGNLATMSLFTPKVTLDELVIFSRQMYSLSKSGIPILRAINGLAESSSSKLMTKTLLSVAEQLERGRSISSAMHSHPKIFNQLYVSIVHVGENTGKLDEVFLQLATYLEREQETRKQIKAAVRYPTFVIAALVIAMVILNIWVIPIFAGMFIKLGANLPFMTKLLMASSDLFVTQWPYMLVVTIASVWGLKRYIATDRGCYNWDKLKLNLPIVGDIVERSLLSRYARSFSMMLSSGVPLTTSLNLVADAVDNRYMGQRIVDMRRNIEKGDSLLRASSHSELFTPLVLQMVSVGEETGRVDELLGDVAEYYEREVDYDIKNLTSKIEPILIVFVAIMVLILALGIFTPMWEMASAYKGAS
ncbi:type II secretion system F family protein [Alteromonadaceae bacterium BrNp21-10]|nr:type II secretion system F family protein [Alteromonadaceae bacterium BrNp21-10]